MIQLDLFSDRFQYEFRRWEANTGEFSLRWTISEFNYEEIQEMQRTWDTKYPFMKAKLTGRTRPMTADPDYHRIKQWKRVGSSAKQAYA